MRPERLDVRFVQWLALGGLVGAVVGVGAAFFLFVLQEATAFRLGHPELIYGLPLAGLLMGLFYERVGKPVSAGTNLVIDTLYDEAGPPLPWRMAPLILLGTVLTHLFGGSAGREGTAVQMGAGLADALAQRLSPRGGLRPYFLAAGVAGGFSAVFGTPVAAALFSLEFIVVGQMHFMGLFPALIAALAGNAVARALGVTHLAYAQVPQVDLSFLLFGKLLLFAAAAAATAACFIELMHGLTHKMSRWLPRLPWRMTLGGILLVLLAKAVGNSAYLGLGELGIQRAFVDPHNPPYGFVFKMLFTALTLGSGFLGGEVTPLFFVGAGLGNLLAQVLDLPLGFGAGLGLAAVFAAAANTPLALSMMLVEMLGVHMLPHAMVVCVTANVLVGHRSIYPAQRLKFAKSGRLLSEIRALREGPL
jgi:H+/Cl- antiporter ClcA